MALESVTHISDLVVSNPTAGDPVSQADDHLRNIKTALKNDFPNVSGAVTPTHTQLNAAAGPAFSAVPSGAQSIPTGTLTKIAFQTEQFDTNGCFDNATNYRFQPNVAGYYIVTACVVMATGVPGLFASVNKNGLVSVLRGTQFSALGQGSTVSGMVQMNGSTDYIELAVLHGNGSSVNTSAAETFFQAHMARAL